MAIAHSVDNTGFFAYTIIWHTGIYQGRAPLFCAYNVKGQPGGNQHFSSRLNPVELLDCAISERKVKVRFPGTSNNEPAFT